jgi:ankyrin repeat protein
MFFFSQQAPFYFLNSVPAAVKISGEINLSFFRNQSVVFQYRYKLELPYGVVSDIDRRLITWSGWTKDNLTELNVPRLDQEGGYKLIIEYMTPELGETKKFEKPFYVYRDNPKVNNKIAESKTAPVIDKPPAKITPSTQVTDKPPAKPSPATNRAESVTLRAADRANSKTPSKTTANTIPANDNKNRKKEVANDSRTALKDAKKVINPETLPSAGKGIIVPSDKNAVVENTIVTDYDELLAEAIERKDAVLFRNSILNGASCNIKNINGGNIFHIIDGTIASEELISMIKEKGVSINETDNYGNSPLHLAILDGESGYARSLISQGADLNMKNNQELSPLHIASFRDNEEVVKYLLNKGAEIDLKGNSGYTPLHIASEMNHITVAKDLLMMGAKSTLKTDQKLTAKALAKIQGNGEIYKMICKKGSYMTDSMGSYSVNNIIQLYPVKQNPKFDFNLPYDKELAKKRQFNKVVQIISVPLFIAGTSLTTYLNHEANNYYKLYKRAESEDIAKVYFDKTKKYDSFTYISGGISLVNLYGFIHSTLKKKSISNRMSKTIN